MMSIRYTPVLLGLLLLPLSCETVSPAPADMTHWEGLVINEIAAHDQTVDAVSWVELLNTSNSAISVNLFFT